MQSYVLTPYQPPSFSHFLVGIQKGIWYQCNYKRFNPRNLWTPCPPLEISTKAREPVLGLPAPCIWRYALEILPIAHKELDQHSSTYHATRLTEAKDLSTPRLPAWHLSLAELSQPTHLSKTSRARQHRQRGDRQAHLTWVHDSRPTGQLCFSA